MMIEPDLITQDEASTQMKMHTNGLCAGCTNLAAIISNAASTTRPLPSAVRRKPDFMRAEVILSRIRNLEDRFEQLPLTLRVAESNRGDDTMARGSSATIQEVLGCLNARVNAVEKNSNHIKEYVEADGSLADAWQAINGLQQFQADLEQITGGCAC